VMRGTGPIGYPGAAEVVNMRPPAYLIKAGVKTMPCIGDGRQSGTSASPSILNASPEAAAGGNLAILETGDRVRVDMRQGRVDVLIEATEIARRRAALEAAGGYAYPVSQTPWQQMQREQVGQLDSGMVLESAVAYQRVAEVAAVPRDNH
jgi:dihydroxy-acid dehydratase